MTISVLEQTQHYYHISITMKIAFNYMKAIKQMKPKN